ncbi:hypothetical protein LX32DRAFT_647466 [Colletotrichum zoysiae]|uniref:Uncharacterized protein n=1 Tax=Colletotrichum zoysiae TaxID=1216348 RepID=A0AAD9LT69_9PEZI|nr:hypothetical protein LX32DRAFT_647466 [Colletotrichum zoysiae]
MTPGAMRAKAGKWREGRERERDRDRDRVSRFDTSFRHPASRATRLFPDGPPIQPPSLPHTTGGRFRTASNQENKPAKKPAEEEMTRVKKKQNRVWNGIADQQVMGFLVHVRHQTIAPPALCPLPSALLRTNTPHIGFGKVPLSPFTFFFLGLSPTRGKGMRTKKQGSAR